MVAKGRNPVAGLPTNAKSASSPAAAQVGFAVGAEPFQHDLWTPPHGSPRRFGRPFAAPCLPRAIRRARRRSRKPRAARAILPVSRPVRRCGSAACALSRSVDRPTCAVCEIRASARSSWLCTGGNARFVPWVRLPKSANGSASGTSNAGKTGTGYFFHTPQDVVKVNSCEKSCLSPVFRINTPSTPGRPTGGFAAAEFSGRPLRTSRRPDHRPRERAAHSPAPGTSR